MVRECRELEDVFETNFTGQILSECSGDVDVRQIKAAITKVHKEKRLVTSVCEKAPLIGDVAKNVGWSRPGCGIWHMN